MTQVWVVAQVKESGWELGGVFSTEARAREVCTTAEDAYWPVKLDTFLGRDTVEPPPGYVFPVTERPPA